MRLFLGIDVGTSATKALILREDGAVLATASSAHPISHPRPGWSEQNPIDWWQSTVLAVREAISRAGVTGEEVGAVGMSGQMHGSVFLPRGTAAAKNLDSGAALPVRPALLWNDQRTARECEEVESALGGRAAMVGLVGNAALTGFTAPKILWLRNNEPTAFALVGMVCMPKDYVRFRLTRTLATDVGDASGTLLFDIHERKWSERACAAVGLDVSLLPPVLESSAVAGVVSAEAGAETGLRAGTPVVAGSGDNMTGAVGSGVVEPGVLAATLGTSGVIIAPAERPITDAGAAGTPAGRTHTMCSAAGADRGTGAAAWCVTGCMLSAGGSLKWLRDALFPGIPYETLDAEAAAVPPGAGGLIFLPYLTGERCPYPDPLARGAFVGLTTRHGRGHLVRAVLEGVAFGMAQILDLVRGLGVPAGMVHISGGGAASGLWRQIHADILRTPVAVTNSTEGPALGAAMLAGVGVGAWSSVSAACRALIRADSVTQPGARSADGYALAREVYGRLYGQLKPEFASLSVIDATA